MNKRIAFDVDGTIITTGSKPQPRKEIIALMQAFFDMGWDIYVHSGGGVRYAVRWVSHLNLGDTMKIHVVMKGDKKIHYDIVVDDCIDEKDWMKKKHGNYIKGDYFIKV